MIEFKSENGEFTLSAEVTVPQRRAEVFAFFMCGDASLRMRVRSN